MSVEFDSDNEVIRAVPTASSISHAAFTITARVKMAANTGDQVVVMITTANSQSIELRTVAGVTAWRVAHNFNATGASIGTGNVDEWISIALVGAMNGSNYVIRGYLRNAGGSMQTVEHQHSHQYADTLASMSLGNDFYGGSSGTRCEIADFKLWARALTQGEIEDELIQSAVAVSTNLICYNDFGGANIGEALTSDTSNQTGFDTWVAEDIDGTTASSPTWSSDNPSYAAPDPGSIALSGAVAMPDTIPTIGVGVAETVINSVESGSSVAVTFPESPDTGTPVVVFMGGWMETASAVTLTDNRGGTWTPLGLQRIGTSKIWLGAWYGLVAAGSTTGLTISATPQPASGGNFLTLTAHRIAQSYSAMFLDLQPVFATGTSTAPAVDLPTTRNTTTLLLSACAWLSGSNSAAAGANWTQVSAKQGMAGLFVQKRTETSAGNYDPAFTLAESDQWIAMGFAITQDPPDVDTGVIVSPSVASVVVNQSVQFSATLDGSSTGPFTWTVESGVGSVAITGLYTAPATTGSAVVRAAETANLTNYAEAAVTVISDPGTGVQTTVSTTLLRSGVAFANQTLDYVVFNSANAVIAQGVASTNGSGVLTVYIPIVYSGQKVMLYVENVGTNMLTSGRFYAAAVEVAA